MGREIRMAFIVRPSCDVAGTCDSPRLGKRIATGKMWRRRKDAPICAHGASAKSGTSEKGIPTLQCQGRNCICPICTGQMCSGPRWHLRTQMPSTQNKFHSNQIPSYQTSVLLKEKRAKLPKNAAHYYNGKNFF